MLKKYNVDYCGQKDLYQNAEDSYCEGEQVEIYYDFLATDTSYCFYLDGTSLPVNYERGRGYAVRFTMPAHDVKLEIEEKNTLFSPLE